MRIFTLVYSIDTLPSQNKNFKTENVAFYIQYQAWNARVEIPLTSIYVDVGIPSTFVEHTRHSNLALNELKGDFERFPHSLPLKLKLIYHQLVLNTLDVQIGFWMLGSRSVQHAFITEVQKMRSYVKFDHQHMLKSTVVQHMFIWLS